MLLQCSFSLPTRIEFGFGKAVTVGQEAKEFGANKVMLMADKNVLAHGLTAKIQQSLSDYGINYVVYDKIAPDPCDFHCDDGFHFAKAEGIDLIVAVGGGSCMDLAKGVGILLTHGGKIQDFCGNNLLSRDITPVIAIPTTAGTGSEVTPFSVITDSSSARKLCISDEHCLPKLAIIDPDMILTLPSKTMAACGIDALTHAIEAYTCRLATPFTDAYAESAMRRISEYLPQAVESHDPASCAQMMLASTMAGIAFGHADVAAVHCIAEAIGGKYHIAHGAAIAMFLPEVIRFNAETASKKYEEIVELLDLPNHKKYSAAEQLAEYLEKLICRLGLSKFSQVSDVDPKDFVDLSLQAEANISNASNIRTMTALDYQRILEKVYDGV